MPLPLILIAGGTGFIGSHILQELAKLGRRVRVLTRDVSTAKNTLRLIKDIEYVEGDVRRPESLERTLDGVQAVVSCVQFPGHPIENPSKGYTYENFDTAGTRNLVEAAKRAGTVRRFVYLSGAGVRDERPEPWFRAKYKAEAAIINSEIPYTIFRPSWVYGPEDRSLNRFIGFARRLPFVPMIGNGRNRVQPLFIQDLATIVSRSLSLERASNRIYEIGGPQTLTMNEIVRTVLDAIGSRKPLIHQPASLMKWASAALALLPAPPLTPGAVDFITMEELVDNTDVLKDFGIELTKLEDALATYLKPRSR